jgi:hypothetical protein
VAVVVEWQGLAEPRIEALFSRWLATGACRLDPSLVTEPVVTRGALILRPLPYPYQQLGAFAGVLGGTALGFGRWPQTPTRRRPPPCLISSATSAKVPGIAGGCRSGLRGGSDPLDRGDAWPSPALGRSPVAGVAPPS